jgi:hypothetical protein
LIKMKAPSFCLPASTAALMLLGSLGAARADTVKARCDIYPKGTDTAAKVVACTFSQRQGYVAIDRADGRRHEFSPRGSAGNYIDETGQKAIRSQGLGSKGQIYRLARESIYVYWDTAGLPGGAQAMPAPARPIILPASAAPAAPFDQTLTLQGISFRVTSNNSGPRNELQIVPSGLSIDNTPIVRAIEGQITGAEVADLNVDGSPELYVYIRSAGPGGFGSLVAFSANRRKSLSEIHLPPVSDDAQAARGYRGHDDFAVVEATLARRFPVYRDGDNAASPSGGVRQMHYKLKPGEASWQLRLHRVDGY